MNAARHSGGSLATLGWSLLLVAGVAATVLQLRDPAPAEPASGHAHDDASARPQRLYAWDVEQARTLALAADGRERRFERQADGRWREPGARDGQPELDVQAYLAMLSQARVDRELARQGTTAPTALADYGLAPPRLLLQVRGADGAELARLAVGQRTPDGYGRYALAPQRDGVLVIAHYQFGAALQALGVADPAAPRQGASGPAGRRP